MDIISAATTLPDPLQKLSGATAPFMDFYLQMQGQKAANRENRYLAQQERLWNEKMWNQQNAYNHPVQQMARLKEAGLNPRMIYNTGASSAVGTAGDVKGYSRAEMKSATQGAEAFSKFVDFRALQAQTDNVRAQTAVAKQDALKKAVETSMLGTQDKYLETQLKQNIEKMTASIEGERLKNQGANISNKTAMLEFETLSQTQKARILFEAAKLRRILTETEGMKQENALKKWRVELSKKGLSEYDNKFFRMILTNWEEIMSSLTPNYKRFLR